MPVYLNFTVVTKVLFSKKLMPFNALRKLWAQVHLHLSTAVSAGTNHIGKCVKGISKHLYQEMEQNKTTGKEKQSTIKSGN